MEVVTALKKYFGYDEFRGGQKELIEAILSKRDVLGIMPTGAGKSICFQLPALLMNGIAVVISPLISLMQDQVNALIQSGISAAYINSTLTSTQISLALRNAIQGKYKLIYVAPERLLTKEFVEFASNVSISMITVDEAHCISQWGQDFRPSYAQIPLFLKQLPSRPIVSAFTATATDLVREDIIKQLTLLNPYTKVTGFDRENLFFEVQQPKHKMDTLLSFLASNKQKSGIIYCLTRKIVEEVHEQLRKLDYSVSYYHAGLGDEVRQRNQDDFLYDRTKIMVATNAFGMGIDKSNVSYVVHYNMPKDLESYYQEAGRAGRDGSEAHCLLLYGKQDVRTNLFLIEHAKEDEYESEEIRKQLQEKEQKRLQKMTYYATSTTCLRASILKYFGETPKPYCGKCSNCLTQYEQADMTVEAQKVLSCIARLDGRFGAGMVVDVLRGSKNKRIFEYHLDQLTTYGISNQNDSFLHTMIDQLLADGYIMKQKEYATLSLTPHAKELLLGQEKLIMNIPIIKHQVASASLGDSDALLASLKTLRAAIAREQRVPAYVVFTDHTLKDMCQKQPITAAQFLTVSGVGERKLEQYGKRFMEVIAQHRLKNSETAPILMND